MGKIRKHSSKRITLRKKYSVDKKVKDHKRKLKKEVKKMKKQGILKKAPKKMPGIPNLYPFKNEMLDAIERKEAIDAEMKEQAKSLRVANNQLPKGTLDNYASEVQAKVIQFEDKHGTLTQEEIKQAEELMIMTGEINETRQMAQSRRAYYKELKKVIDASDVILQILDARDPQGCRSEEIENGARQSGKKVVQVINKIDLVPPQNARAWLRYLRNEFPVVLFKASQQNQHSNLAGGATLYKKSLINNSEMVDKMTSLSSTVGAENLLNILKNYARVDSKNMQQITVGVVGFPNVGKSSLINSLKRQRAAATGNTPGVTKTMQEIQLDKNIILLDSPGVVLSTEAQSSSLTLRQAIKVEGLEDPVKPVEALLSRVDEEEFFKLYRIGKWTSTENMLGQVARKRGLIKPGGIANIEEAARSVLRDYQSGKIPYFTAPPTTLDGSDSDMQD